MIRTVRRCSASTPPPSAGSRSATSGSRAGPRGQPTAQDLLETARALRCLQLDPTAVVARSHLLVLFSRHGAFDETLFEELAYGDRALFEYWAHEASYVLSEDLPIHRYAMRAAERRRVAGEAERLVGRRSTTSARTSSSASTRRARCARATSRIARRSRGSGPTTAGGRARPTSPACST